MSKTILVSGPVIVEGGKALLDQSGEDDFWKFCGGRAKTNENLKETAIRRAEEELGIKVKILNDKPFLMHKEKKAPGGKINITLVHFLAERQGEIVPGPDVSKWDWIDVNNLPKNIGPNIKPALRYFKFIKHKT